jgi:hypothetical protein
MSNSVHKDKQGPIWPLGNIAVPTPGTYVSIMSLVDSGFTGAPETATPGTAGAAEYTNRAYAIIFQGFKAGAAPPKLAANTGVIYIVKTPIAAAGGVADVGTVIAAIRPTDPPFILTSAPLNRNTLNLYEYYIDADTAADGCQVVAIIQ